MPLSPPAMSPAVKAGKSLMRQTFAKSNQRRHGVAFVTLLPAALLAGCATIPAAAPEPVEIRIVGLNDFHGNLEPIRRPVMIRQADGSERPVPTGGIAWLASAVQAIRARSEHSLAIAAGDLIGASPLASSLFLDEPAIGAMNRLGLDFNAVGNHEFDRGWQELRRIQQGGCDKLTLREPCAVENPYPGARFPFLAANVRTPDGGTLFAPYAIRRFGTGAREVAVGVIGLTLKDTPTLVTPSGVAGLTFADEAETINALVPRLEAEGADAIVVAIHQGMRTEVGYNDKNCGGVSGPLLDILARLDPRVDLVISGHTHATYVCDYGTIDPARPFLVTSAGYGGSFLTDIVLSVDPVRGVVAKRADNVVVQSEGRDAHGNPLPLDPALNTLAPHPEIAAYVGRYVEAARAASERPVGRITGDGRKGGPATEETPLGNMIADAQLAATRGAGAQIALMNNSGIRAALTPREGGVITYGDIYAVQPFGNTLVTKSFTGAQLLALLEQQFDDDGFVQTFSPSAGFTYAFDMGRPAGARVVRAALDGQPIDPAASYRVTMNSFLAAGGDSFTLFNEGRDAVTGAVDLDALEAWLAAHPALALPATGRIADLTRE